MIKVFMRNINSKFLIACTFLLSSNIANAAHADVEADRVLQSIAKTYDYDGAAAAKEAGALAPKGAMDSVADRYDVLAVGCPGKISENYLRRLILDNGEMLKECQIYLITSLLRNDPKGVKKALGIFDNLSFIARAKCRSLSLYKTNSHGRIAEVKIDCGESFLLKNLPVLLMQQNAVPIFSKSISVALPAEPADELIAERFFRARVDLLKEEKLRLQTLDAQTKIMKLLTTALNSKPERSQWCCWKR